MSTDIDIQSVADLQRRVESHSSSKNARIAEYTGKRKAHAAKFFWWYLILGILTECGAVVYGTFVGLGWTNPYSVFTGYTTPTGEPADSSGTDIGTNWVLFGAIVVAGIYPLVVSIGTRCDNKFINASFEEGYNPVRWGLYFAFCAAMKYALTNMAGLGNSMSVLLLVGVVFGRYMSYWISEKADGVVLKHVVWSTWGSLAIEWTALLWNMIHLQTQYDPYIMRIVTVCIVAGLDITFELTFCLQVMDACGTCISYGVAEVMYFIYSWAALALVAVMHMIWRTDAHYSA